MTTTDVLLLSGPNLNLLGEREPEKYGSDTLEDLVKLASAAAADHGIELDHFQSNAESDLVDSVQSARGRYAAIIINAGALTHYGWSLHDALAAYDGLIVELHITNPLARESWRHLSVISPVARGTISGFGSNGYVMAVEAVAKLLKGE